MMCLEHLIRFRSEPSHKRIFIRTVQVQNWTRTGSLWRAVNLIPLGDFRWLSDTHRLRGGIKVYAPLVSATFSSLQHFTRALSCRRVASECVLHVCCLLRIQQKHRAQVVVRISGNILVRDWNKQIAGSTSQAL